MTRQMALIILLINLRLTVQLVQKLQPQSQAGRKNSSFVYTAPITSAFYTLKDNTLNYTSKKSGEQFTIKGIKDINTITVSGKNDNKL